MHQRDDIAVVLVHRALPRHEERLHGELGLAGDPLDLRRVAERIRRRKRNLRQRLHGPVDARLVGADRAGQVHVLVGLAGVVPGRDRQLARQVGQAVVRRGARVDVDEEARQLHAGEVIRAVGRADVREVQRELVPGARVEDDLAIRLLEAVHVMVRVAPVVRLHGLHLARLAAAREDAEQRPAVGVLADELGEARLLEDVLGEHRGEVDLDRAVEQNVVVVRHHQVVHVRRGVVVRASRRLVPVFVEFVKHRFGRLAAPVHFVEERDAPPAGAVRLVHGAVVARVHHRG